MPLITVAEDPWMAEVRRLRRDMADVFGALKSGRPVTDPLWGRAKIFPLLNVMDRGDAYIVVAEIPGLKADDINLKVEGDTLCLSGNRRPDEFAGEVSYHRRERACGAFQRSLTLPRRVDSSGVEAAYKDGVLTVTLPILKEVAPKTVSVAVD